MNHSEELAFNWFSKNHQVAQVPQGEDPPDFVLDDKIALEVTGIHQPFSDKIWTHISDLLIKNKYGISDDYFSHVLAVSMDHDRWDSNDQNERRIYRKLVGNAVLKVARDSCQVGLQIHQNYIYTDELNEIEITVLVIREPVPYPTFHMGSLSHFKGEFLYESMLQTTKNALLRKANRCAEVITNNPNPDCKYWWLAVVNHHEWSIGRDFIEIFRDAITIPKDNPFEKILLLNFLGKDYVYDEYTLFP